MKSPAKPPVDGRTIDALRRLSVEALRALPRGEVPVSHQTQSMAPLFRGGEILSWERIEGRPAWGAIVIFVGRLHDEETGFPRPIVHRVLQRRPSGAIRAKGDARPWFDLHEIPAEDILGVVVAFRTGDRKYELTTRGARFYAGVAGALSWAGAWTYKLAVVMDALLRRLLPGFGDRRSFRRIFDLGQRLGQRFLYAALFRTCHRGAKAPQTSEETRKNEP